MLTSKQRELLLFIDARVKESGVAPSIREMREALGVASNSGIHWLVVELEERGFIRRLAHKARAVQVIKLPGGGPASRHPSVAPPAPAITDKMLSDAREAYRKSVGADDHQLDGWIDDALRAAFTAALTPEAA